jgi:hypothetical protein
VVTVYVIDPSIRATISGMEFFSLQIAAIRNRLGREPVIARSDLTAWGHVTRKEVEALVRAECEGEMATFLDEELAMLDRLAAAYPPERTAWSISVPGAE